jgi:hypothetical protein
MDVAHLRFYFGEGAKATMGEGYWVYIKTGDRRQTCADSDSSSVRPKKSGVVNCHRSTEPRSCTKHFVRLSDLETWWREEKTGINLRESAGICGNLRESAGICGKFKKIRI